MVDVGAKAATKRVAVAECLVRLGPTLFEALLRGGLPKGDALAVARVAGIQAAKRTSELIPLCHLLALDYVRIDFEAHEESHSLRVLCEAATTAGTGVEMEALTGASTAALTIYDMGKAVHRGIVVDGLRLLHKEGGRSGLYVADAELAADGGEGSARSLTSKHGCEHAHDDLSDLDDLNDLDDLSDLDDISDDAERSER